jgi:hypothetical protein
MTPYEGPKMTDEYRRRYVEERDRYLHASHDAAMYPLNKPWFWAVTIVGGIAVAAWGLIS